MKKIFLLLVGTTFLFTSCAIHNGLTTNMNNSTTEVVLSKKNFKIVESVEGTAKATYVLGIGGLGKNAIIYEARKKMLSKANIIGSTKALINENVEVKHSFFPFFRTYRVTVSSNVVEFFE